jgi:hypothetical protein
MSSNPSITDVKAAVLQWTGTADAVSADPVTTWAASGSGVTTYSGSWAQANTPATTVPTTAPTLYKIEGITLSSTLTNLGVMIWNDDTTTTNADQLFIGDVQLEKGAVCTDFERITYAHDLANCQRFYIRYSSSSQYQLLCVGQVNNAAGGGGVMYLALPAAMRSSPTLAVSSVDDWTLVSAAFGATTSPTSMLLYSYVPGSNSAAIICAGGGALGANGDTTALLSDTGVSTAWLSLSSEL